MRWWGLDQHDGCKSCNPEPSTMDHCLSAHPCHIQPCEQISKIKPSLSLCPTYQFLFVHVLSWFIFVPHSTNEQNWALRALKNYTRMNITSDSRLDAVLLVLSTQSWHLSANWFWSKSLITFTFRAFSLFLVSFEGGFTKKILYFGGNACKKNEIASWQKFVKSGQQ